MTEKENANPAGMFYFSLIDPIIKASKNKTNEEIKEELKKKFRMNGMIVADINIIKKMDKTLEKGASSSIPVYLDKDGNISKGRSNAITKEEFTRLQKTAEKVIKQIAKEILEGNIDIKPVYSKKTKVDACKYCEYKSICGFDPNINNYSYIENKTKEEICVNSTSWGNYYNATFKYMNSNGILVTKDKIRKIIPTGSTEYTKANNIYDLAGNIGDWTMEANYRVARGGSYYDLGNQYYASVRYPNQQINVLNYRRMPSNALYKIKQEVANNFKKRNY